MSLEELQKEVDGYIQEVPRDYYSNKRWGQCIVYCDEDGRSKQKTKNPHFRELSPGWYIVGDCLKEEVYHDAQAED